MNAMKFPAVVTQSARGAGQAGPVTTALIRDANGHTFRVNLMRDEASPAKGTRYESELPAGAVIVAEES